MAQGDRSDRSKALHETITRHLPQIEAWKAEGVPQREIARRLHLPDSSLRGALKHLATTPATHPTTDAYLSIPNAQPPRSTRVYEGVPATNPEAIKVVVEETTSLLPTIREMAENWDTLREMIGEYRRQRQLLEVSPEYQGYEGFYSCRLSHQLIKDLRAYAAAHRLSQSELITLALQAYMRQP